MRFESQTGCPDSNYNWILLGEGGETVASSSGASFQLDYDLIELKRDDTILICGGVDIQSHTSKGFLIG